jgi:multidrug transporter EmrE-like cation transporter
MTGPVFAMSSDPGWQRDTAIAVLVVLAMAAYFVRATASRKGEQNRRLGLGLAAFLGSPLLAVSLAGLVHAFGHVQPLDVGHVYSSFLGIGTMAGCILGLFFVSTSLLSSNDHERSPRKLNP